MLCGSTIADALAVRISFSSINGSPTDLQRLGQTAQCPVNSLVS